MRAGPKRADCQTKPTKEEAWPQIDNELYRLASDQDDLGGALGKLDALVLDTDSAFYLAGLVGYSVATVPLTKTADNESCEADDHSP
ncbi:hypothetical protein RJ55_04306 [Drechmeria coniospora]|nr:hypothetical protein RJ55_04306 [Drechmeria coniospora]